MRAISPSQETSDLAYQNWEKKSKCIGNKAVSNERDSLRTAYIRLFPYVLWQPDCKENPEVHHTTMQGNNWRQQGESKQPGERS